MKYMLQIRFNRAELEKLTTREQDAMVAEYIGISRLPGVLDGNQLQPAETATTVRVHDGETLITDGLPVDSAAALDGYYLYEAPDLEQAIKLAARIPAARIGGTVEVRPLVDREPTAALPALTEGIVLTHFIVSDDVERSGHFYTDVLGGETVLAGEPTIVALANSWIIINLAGGPTDDKPAATLETPRNPDQVSSFLNIRVAPHPINLRTVARTRRRVPNPTSQQPARNPRLHPRPRPPPDRAGATDPTRPPPARLDRRSPTLRRMA